MESLLFIDGENFKGKIKSVFEDAGKPKPIWHEYDFKRLLDKVLTGIERHGSTFYFARIKEHPDSVKKSRELILEQRLLKTHLETQGFKVIMAGRVNGFKDSKGFLQFKEKGVDVRVAVDMVSLACDKKVTRIILASSDSDLQPALEEANNRGIEAIYVGFEAKPNKGLTYNTSRTILIRNSEVFEFEKIQKTIT